MGRPRDGQSAPRVSDEELEYYGDLYLQCEIRGSGVDFENFLDRPEYYLQRYAKRAWKPRSDRDGKWGFRRLLGPWGPARSPSD